MPRMFAASCFLMATCASLQAATVSGRVEMPETCSPAVSPAVVVLEPKHSKPSAPRATPARLVLVRQAGLVFLPRVQVLRLGQTLVFTNEDSETHSVHNIGAGLHFNPSMAPGGRVEVVPEAEGVIRLVCDIHSHMRAYVIVTASPWAAVCGGAGTFRFENVPPGQYTLRAWHEMGDPLRQNVTVTAADLNVGVLKLTGPAVAAGSVQLGPVRPWPEVIDRIAITLATSLDAARRPAEAKRARRLTEDAYWVEFEGSRMETAISRFLGMDRTFELESRFREAITAVRKVAAGELLPAEATSRFAPLMLGLSRAADDLNRLHVTDSATIDMVSAPAPVAAGPVDAAGLLTTLDRLLDQVQAVADANRPDEASSALTDAYFEAFEPLESRLQSGDALGGTVPRLEAQFNALRGRLAAGLKGPELASALAAIRTETAAALSRTGSAPLGAFGAAFGVSLITILREGLEVILLLTMLIAIVAQMGGQQACRAALRWGVGLATVASLATAAALNLTLAATAGRTRELLEGGVMLAATAVLFYVSYWLISRSEAKRWSDFLKRQVQHGAQLGQSWTLGLAAFLAVYREGAETALMYQALFGTQTARLGQIGLWAGLGVGLLLLAALYVLVRRASVRLPLKAFFKVSGALLFAMAVVFAGKGVFELQNAGLIRVTGLPWLGPGLPLLGVYPNLQVLSVQALLLCGAAVALGVLLVGEALGDRPAPSAAARVAPAAPAPAKAGAGV